MSFRLLTALGICVCLFASNASAVVFTDQIATTSSGQLHNFSFSPVPATSINGVTMLITLQGDYSPRSFPPLSEGAAVAIDVAGGALQLYNNSGSAAVGSNTVAGLSLLSTSQSGGGNTYTLNYEFGLSSALASAITADNAINIGVQSTNDVDPGTSNGPDFVALTISIPTAVPEPATATLAMLGLGGLMMRRRRLA